MEQQNDIEQFIQSIDGSEWQVNSRCNAPNNLNFLAPYNPHDPPELFFKRCADCQEIAIIAKAPYTEEQLLMNVINLLTHCSMYRCDMEDWDRRADTNKTWLHLHPFIQTAYQCCLQTCANMAAAQGGYTNRYACLFAEDEVSNDDNTESIGGTINSHMTNIPAQTNASIKANTTQINALLQQLAVNNNQLNLQQKAILQQMAMLSTNPPHTTMARTYVPPVPHTFSPPPLQGYQ
jgi:hypothetical protein